jgi:peptide chain release factor 1
MIIKEKIQEVKRKYNELSEKFSHPEIFSNQEEYQKVVKEYVKLSKIIKLINQYESINREILDTTNLYNNSEDEMKELAKNELENLNKEKNKLEKEIIINFMPNDIIEKRNVILEIRAAAGGEEAALFVADLFKMYTKYIEKQSWKMEMISHTPTSLGGFKEIIFSVTGKLVYLYLKYESGVHRVQRIPITEASGRIHTSTATVAVLPEPEEIELKIAPEDLKIETFCSSGPGGQSVNTAYSAVRITHIPTGIVVQCQDERSQLRNKEKAMRVLRARILNKIQQEQHKSITNARKMQIGTGERSEKIRTYNFPQNRVTDHRINLTLYNLEEVLSGELDEIINAHIENEIKNYIFE